MNEEIEDLTDFFNNVDLERVIQGYYLDADMFTKNPSYEHVRGMKMDIGAVAIIINKDRSSPNCILAVSRKNDVLDFGLPGGKADDGENILQALLREVAEETGLGISGIKLVYVARAIDRLCFTFLCETTSQEYENREQHLGARLEFVMIGDLLVTNYHDLANIVLDKDKWPSELYFSYLNRYKTNHRHSTFCNYNFRALQKLLGYKTLSPSLYADERVREVFGRFSGDFEHLFNRAMFESQFINLLDIEKMQEK